MLWLVYKLDAYFLVLHRWCWELN